MKTKVKIVPFALGALIAAGTSVNAQSLINNDPVENRVDAIIENTEDQFEKADDDARFGNQTFQEGWRGSVFASANLTTGNTDTSDVSVGAKVTSTVGAWNQRINLAYEFGEANGTTSKNEIYSLYEVNRDFTERFYGFALVRGQKDFVNNTSDVYLSFGPGYRIVNQRDFTWRVQAGPGYRVSTSGGVVPDFDEAGVSASSRIFYRMNSSVFFTNDTDVIWSNNGTQITNDAGMNVALSGPLSLRVGVKTDYDSNPAPGLKDTDTTTGVALVYAF